MVGGIDTTDFTNGPLADLGQTVSRIPVTVTRTGNGDRIETQGSPVSITAIVSRRKQESIQVEEGHYEISELRMMVATTTTINEFDIIQYRGKQYQAHRPITRYSPLDIPMFTRVDLVEIGDS